MTSGYRVLKLPTVTEEENMTLRKSLAILGLMGAMASIVAGPAAADSFSDIKAAGKIRVAIDLASPPNACSTQA
jgi:ABC-type amino acid transport substrate-binding protein